MTQSVNTWARLAMTLLLLSGVAALFLSFLPVGNRLGIDTHEALLVMGLSALTPIAQYALIAWGVIAADLAALLTLASLAVVTAVYVRAFIVRQRRKAAA